MADDSDADLFGGSSASDDTDELIASSKSKAKPIAKKKAPPKRNRLQKKKSAKKDPIPDADDGSDDEDNGLFDSDEEGDKKPSASSSANSSPTKVLSKRERMEALRAKKRAATASTQEQSSKNKSSSKNKKDDGTSGGYGSEDSYNSATYVRTAEDDDFIDTQGEDEELVKEYYAEQHFDDERPDELEEMEVKTKKSSGRRSTTKKRGPDQLSEQDKKDKDNPISIAVERMKKKKKVPKRFEELKDSAVELIDRMEDAAKQDDRSFRAKKPGLKKLQMLPEVLNAMIKREMMRPLLEADFLTVAKTWIEPLSDGSLGNVTMRQKMIDGISKMNGDFGIDNDDLKRSEFGKLVMTLYMHKKETPEMKRRLKSLIEQWSRRIFRKSGDMKNLGTSQAQRRGDSGLVGIARAQAASNESQMANQRRSGQKRENKDLGSILSGGVKQAQTSGSNRVRVPYSKGFQYTVRPDNKSGDVSDKKTRISTVTDQRESLHRRMLDKNKRGGKNSRSANISIEGRPTK